MLLRLWRQIAPVALGVALALLLRTFVIESFYVPSESMLPTLLVGDHMFVNKFAYGPRVPGTDWRLPGLRDPERGEVVVFSLGRTDDGRVCPLDLCPDAHSEDFVKRLVGVPGDTVEVRSGGRVFVNGEPLPLRGTGRTFENDRGQALRLSCETLGDGEHAVLEDPARSGPRRTPLTVPPGRYFAMGDNRDDSNDSRVWGTFPHTDLKGPVRFIYWSWNNRESWAAMLNPLTWLRLLAGETRWSRTGTRLDQDCRQTGP